MNENVRTAIRWGNETKSFGFIEKLNCSLHFKIFNKV